MSDNNRDYLNVLEQLRASGIKVRQRYRHNATRSIYVVVAVGIMEANLTPLVHYQLENGNGVVWTRSLSNFREEVRGPDGPVPRFELITSA